MARICDFDLQKTGGLEAITRIYGHYVESSTASFELVAPDVAEMGRRFGALVQGGYPVLVALDDAAGVVGYAYCGPYHHRCAYAGTVEDSVYVHKDALGQGVGRDLLAALIERAGEKGYRQIMAVIGGSGNEASIRLHRSAGFVEIGIAREIGFKFGQLLDVVYMQRSVAGR